MRKGRQKPSTSGKLPGFSDAHTAIEAFTTYRADYFVFNFFQCIPNNHFCMNRWNADGADGDNIDTAKSLV
jgi:hypothetical protein